MGLEFRLIEDDSFRRCSREKIAVEKCLSGSRERERERVWSDVINKALTRRQLHLQFFIGAVGRRFQPDRNDGRGADVLVVEGAGRRS